MLPFTAQQFFSVFEAYNDAVWPAQIILYFMTLTAVAVTALGCRRCRAFVMTTFGVLWLWAGVAYHLFFFTRINPAAWVFGAIFVLQGLMFVRYAILHRRVDLERAPGWQGWLGQALIAYACFFYPLLGLAAGEGPRQLPVLGVPCPNTIATLGFAFWLEPKLPRAMLTIPLLWAAIGGSAAFLLGVPQDFTLLVAGAFGLVLLRRQPLSPAELDNRL